MNPENIYPRAGDRETVYLKHGRCYHRGWCNYWRPSRGHKRCSSLRHCRRSSGKDHSQAFFRKSDIGIVENEMVGLAGRKDQTAYYRYNTRASGL